MAIATPAVAQDASSYADASYAYGYHEEPYKLDPGPHLFIDWRYVHAGHVGYSLADGTEVGKEGEGLTGDDIPKVLSTPKSAPFGVRLQAIPAQTKGPVIENNKPWEYLFAYVSMIKVGDEYRIYYEAIPSRDSSVPSNLCMATSKDGINWTKPELGIAEFNGSSANNIVFSAAKCRFGMHGHQVFIDEQAPAEERFKLIYMGTLVTEREPAVIERMKKERPESLNPLGESKELVIMAATSPDGLHWTEHPEPLMAHMNDSGPAVYYDKKLKKYVGYFRASMFGRRSIARGETSDFWNWSSPKLVLWPNNIHEPSDDYYTNSHALYPGTQTMHLMFPVLYKRKIDGGAIRIASSAEGVNWQWIPGDDVVANGPIGSWDAGWFVGGVGLHEIPGDKVVLPYQASPLPHKFPRVIPIGQVGLAIWEKERLSALVADDDAEFATIQLAAQGDELYLNFKSPQTGSVRVQVEGVAGRTFADCDPLYGNELKKKVTWKGDGKLGVEPGQSFRLKIRMHNAKLYSFEIR